MMFFTTAFLKLKGTWNFKLGLHYFFDSKELSSVIITAMTLVDAGTLTVQSMDVYLKVSESHFIQRGSFPVKCAQGCTGRTFRTPVLSQGS